MFTYEVVFVPSAPKVHGTAMAPALLPAMFPTFDLPVLGDSEIGVEDARVARSAPWYRRISLLPSDDDENSHVTAIDTDPEPAHAIRVASLIPCASRPEHDEAPNVAIPLMTTALARPQYL